MKYVLTELNPQLYYNEHHQVESYVGMKSIIQMISILK